MRPSVVMASTVVPVVPTARASDSIRSRFSRICSTRARRSSALAGAVPAALGAARLAPRVADVEAGAPAGGLDGPAASAFRSGVASVGAEISRLARIVRGDARAPYTPLLT